MTTMDVLFLVACPGIGLCCALALVGAVRRWRRAPEGTPADRPVLAAIAALLLPGIALTA